MNNTYTPRPGSRTEAAIHYLTTQGGAATAINLAEAVDTERRNLPATLSSAIAHGVIEVCDLPEGKGYRLCQEADAAPGPAQAEIRQDDDEEVGAPPEAEKYEIPAFLRQAGPDPAPAKARKPRKPTDKESLPVATSLDAAQENWQMEIRPYLGAMPKAVAAKPRKPVTLPPTPKAKPARIGHFSDGSVCIEGPDDLVKITDDYDANRVSVMLSPEIALQLVRFIGADT